jgi:hypothetical protein
MKIINKAKAKPRPRIIPYPKLWLKGAVKAGASDDMV